MDDKHIEIDWARNSHNPTRIVVGRPASCGCHADQRPTTLRINFASADGAETVMKRLPGCDRATLDSELAIFLSLGLLAATIIAISFVGSLRFAIDRDAVIAAIAGDSHAAMAEKPDHAKTNVAVSTPNRLQIQTPSRQPNATPGGPAVQSL